MSFARGKDLHRCQFDPESSGYQFYEVPTRLIISIVPPAGHKL
ncbi:MAG: hypothetical protein ACI8XG_000226 [Congregibacter sp.]|jgi:hypothetical protein